jgi:hypothetical protein
MTLYQVRHLFTLEASSKHIIARFQLRGISNPYEKGILGRKMGANFQK